MKKQTESKHFGTITYTTQTVEFHQPGYVLRHIEGAWKSDGTQLNADEQIILERELKSKGLL